MGDVYWVVDTNQGRCVVRAVTPEVARTILRKWHGQSLEFAKTSPVLLSKRPDPGNALPIWSDHGQEDTHFTDGRPALLGGADFTRLISLGEGMTPDEAYREGVRWAAAQENQHG
jgi:hypothetical protein